MKLVNLEIVGLFGQFDHLIPINNEERITILTAPNGYGKTAALRVVNALFNGRFGYLRSLDFEKITVGLNNCNLCVTKKGESEDSSPSLEFQYSGSADTPKTWTYPHNSESPEYPSLSSFTKRIPWLVRIGPDEWFDEQSSEYLDLDEVLENYSDRFPAQLDLFQRRYPDWLDGIVASIDIHFVQDQRLMQRPPTRKYSKRREPDVHTIEKFASELSHKIQEISLESTEQAQKLDSTFPSRLLDWSYDPSGMTKEELISKLKELNEKQEKLSKHGLVASKDATVLRDPEITADAIKVLTLYAKDTEKKLGVYDELLKRIELFVEILNEKRLSFKEVTVSRDTGFHFVSSRSKRLELTQLSSGEQHEVVLLYELIFRAQENVMVLIDEPEISLHISWQKEFLKDLKRIIDLQNVTAIISTHSPSIIDSNWELTVNLGESKDK